MFIYTMMRALKKSIDTVIMPLTIEVAITSEPVRFENRKSVSYKTFNVGESWGELFSCAWFKLTGSIEVTVNEPLYLKLDLNGEALLYDETGVPVKGFTNGSSNFGFMGHLGSPAKQYFQINQFIKEDGTLELWIDAGMNDLFGNVKKKGRIDQASIVKRDMERRTLYYDLNALLQLKLVALKEDREVNKIYNNGLRKIEQIYLKGDWDWVKKALEVSGALLSLKTNHEHVVSAIGHAHLDLAWLWPIRETRRKGLRTFANALRLMEDYDDFYFGASQPQLYQWVKEDSPSLYEEIRKRINEGRWEVQGGMWVEADTNITGEEALVRQMLYGKKFFREEFGIDVKSLWLPDVFGYSGNMPQIINKSGMDFFMTIKISWNDTNKFPFHTFNWHGIDGSAVFAHMPPEGEYNSPANAYFLRKSMKNYREKHIDNQTLSLFGVGDGGGGVAPSHVERIRRLSGRPAMPNIKMEPSNTFFNKLAIKKSMFPIHEGELYLEKHRGTYTSQGNVKAYNRKMEQRLKTLELILVQSGKYDAYSDKLEKIWKEILLYQFHDILPGSSIKRVYDECIARYILLMKEVESILEEVMAGQYISDTCLVELADLTAYNPLQSIATVDRFIDGIYQQLVIAPQSNVVLSSQEWIRRKIPNTRLIENENLKVTFGSDGAINSIFDKKRNREILRAKGNLYTVYTDIANAWDIDKNYRKFPKGKMKLLSSDNYRSGDVQEVMQIYQYGKSSLVVNIRLRPNCSWLEFDVKSNWYDNKKMLRTAFPLAISTDKATYDIQFGHIERSSRNDTKLEKAQFEMCGHNWVEMSDGVQGASLLTDSKYGFRTKENCIDLNLIKSTNYPAKMGDIGYHEFKYAFYVHGGNLEESRVDELGLHFNAWMPVFKNANVINRKLFEVDNDIVFSTVKMAESKDGILVRLYERNGRNTESIFKSYVESNIVCETNLVEDELIHYGYDDTVCLSFKPFEIKTLKIMTNSTRGGQ